MLKTSDESPMMNVSNSNVYSVPRKRGTEQSSDTQTVLRTSYVHSISTTCQPLNIILTPVQSRYSLRYSLDTLSRYLLLQQNFGYYPICPCTKGSSLILPWQGDDADECLASSDLE